MGFFSWNCKHCNHSIKSDYGLPEEYHYMREAVLLLPSGSIIIGHYDGYGRITDEAGCETEIDFCGRPELWHRKCWEQAGKPSYTGESDHANDQGFFYEENTVGVCDKSQWVL